MPTVDACPRCASALIQPLRWSDACVTFRCPECQSCFRAACSPTDLRTLATAQATARASIVDGYERAVVASMEALVGSSDRLTAEDFRPRPPAAP